MGRNISGGPAASTVLRRVRRIFYKAGTTSITIPVDTVYVKVFGAGGGGAGGTGAGGAANMLGGLGGGGGGYAAGKLKVTPGSTLTVTVGAGGLGGTLGNNGNPGTSGGNGGTSSFGSLISATGGLGGQAFANDTNMKNVDQLGGAGGSGVGGDLRANGGRGGKRRWQYGSSYNYVPSTGGGAAGTRFGGGGTGGDFDAAWNGVPGGGSTGGGGIAGGNGRSGRIQNALNIGWGGGTASAEEPFVLKNANQLHVPLTLLGGGAAYAGAANGYVGSGVLPSFIINTIDEFEDFYDEDFSFGGGGLGITGISSIYPGNGAAGGGGGGGAPCGSQFQNVIPTRGEINVAGNGAHGGSGGLFGGGGGGGGANSTSASEFAAGFGGDGGIGGGGGGSGFSFQLTANQSLLTNYGGKGGDGLVIVEWYE